MAWFALAVATKVSNTQMVLAPSGVMAKSQLRRLGATAFTILPEKKLSGDFMDYKKTVEKVIALLKM